MKNMSKTSIIGWTILIFAIGMGLEILFQWWLLIPLLIGIFILYHVKNEKDLRDNKRTLLLIAGYSLLAIPILSSTFLKLFIIVVVIYGLNEYSKSKKQVNTITVNTIEPGQKTTHFKKKQPFIRNFFAGNQRIVNEIYEWDDINIQCGFGDTVVDLGMTMLPKGESTVVIRGLVGNIQLLIPFDAAVIINHSTVSGKLKVFEEEETELFNSNVIYHPNQDESSIRTIKIITNIVVGNLEVRRI
ncbi:cell wall-active antibiotics response protein LiaF [Lederbergia graminis]|uniref:Cell wall-active antibiotics response protein LiaF n=1 Tax=Lederbergia graminis TaxID=735518 RepID=A0ABW0LDG0_9BACI|nr:cell wall-active antibiotics response protein LiaF [Paenibacillus bovis]HLU23411.1 cell wall-active antibiotics response protein LiaF [Bacillaceae bacterium]